MNVSYPVSVAMLNILRSLACKAVLALPDAEREALLAEFAAPSAAYREKAELDRVAAAEADGLSGVCDHVCGEAAQSVDPRGEWREMYVDLEN